MSKKALVLGAGSAGLMAADCLLRQGYSVKVLEREGRVGGLGSSFKWEGFIMDYGPHAFHVKDGRYNRFFEELFKDDRQDIFYEQRSELLLLRGRLFRYPLRAYELLFKCNPFFVGRMLLDFLMASVIYQFIAVPDDNFESWCIRRFGKSLYRLTFGYYTEKVWGISPRRISPKFAARKIHKLNLRDIIHKLLGGKGEEQETYWMNLIYPKFGSGQLFERLAARVIQNGGIILKNCQVQELAFGATERLGISYSCDGQRGVNEDYDCVISTIPVASLLNLLRPKVNDYVAYTSRLLKSKSLILLNIVFDAPRILDSHWIYLVDKEFFFNRVTEQKNMSAYIGPSEKTVLTLEKTCSYGDAVWRLSREEIFRRAEEDLKKLRFLDLGKIQTFDVIRINDAYPIYDLDFDKRLMVVYDFLSSINNLYSIGRQGLFLQGDLYESMEMGRMVVEDFIIRESYSRDWYDFIAANQGIAE